MLSVINKTEQISIEGRQYAVRRYHLLGSTDVVYEAWERADLVSSHGTVGHMDMGSEQWWGRVGTRNLPAEIEAIRRGTKERFDAVDAFHKVQAELAFALIFQAFPLAKDGTKIGAKIFSISIGGRKDGLQGFEAAP